MRQPGTTSRRAVEQRCLASLQAQADELAADWGVDGVTVVVNRRLRTTAGRAVHASRTIEVASWLLGAGDEAIRDTLAHEFAHVIAGALEPRSSPHGDLWRACAVAAGAEPRARYRSPDLARHWRRYVLYECGRGCQFPRQRAITRRRLNLLRCRPHGLPLALADGTEVRVA